MKHMTKIISQTNYVAELEGWGIFYCQGSEDGDYQLQKIDDSGVFENDLQAISFVKNLAQQGSAIHILAMGIIAVLNPSELQLA
jgi:hypothetical protein